MVLKPVYQTNLKGKGEGHDDVGNNNILQVDDKMRFGGDAKKHPRSHAVEDQPQQEEKGVENRKNHSLQHVVAGASGVRVAVIAGEERREG